MGININGVQNARGNYPLYKSTPQKTSDSFKGSYSADIIDFYKPGAARFSGALKPVRPIISFGFSGKEIDGVIYSPKAQALGAKMLSPQMAKDLIHNCEDKIAEVETNKAKNPAYNNSRMNVIEAASAMGANGKAYTACNVDFFSSRWGMPAGMLASCLAVNGLNNSIKALAVTNMNHDRKSLQWLANTNAKMHSSRGGKELQVVTLLKQPDGKDKVFVQTLDDLKGFVTKDMPASEANTKVEKVPGLHYKPVPVQVNEIVFSDQAKQVAQNLEKTKAIDVSEMIKTLAHRSQQEADRIDRHVFETNGQYENAPVSHYHFHTAMLADNNKIYTATNSEFFDSGFMADVMCSERTAVAKAVNDGAQKAEILFVNNNQNHEDYCCAECLGWLSTARGGVDLLLPSFIRDEKGNKTDKVIVKTLGEYLTAVHKPSPKKA
jgi:cytidine deaminase